MVSYLSRLFGGNGTENDNRRFSINVPIQSEPLNKEDYQLAFPYMNSFIQAHLYKRHPNQVCPFFNLQYLVPRQDYIITGPTMLVPEFQNETLQDILQRMLQCTKRFIIVSLSIYEFAGTYSDGSRILQNGHQNVIIIDQALQTAERYEPHHIAEYNNPYGFYDAHDLDEHLADLFAQINLTYIAPMDYCMRIPSLQNDFNKFPMGLCVVFSFLYAEYRIKFPELERAQVLSRISKKLHDLQSEGNLYDYLTGYITKIQSFASKYAKKHGTRDLLTTTDYETGMNLSNSIRQSGLEKDKKRFDKSGTSYGAKVFAPRVPYDAKFMKSMKDILWEIFSLYEDDFIEHVRNDATLRKKLKWRDLDFEQISRLVLNEFPVQVRDVLDIFLEYEKRGRELTFVQLEYLLNYIITADLPMAWKEQLLKLVQDKHPDIINQTFGSSDCLSRLIYFLEKTNIKN
jgi:hypothetical protein